MPIDLQDIIPIDGMDLDTELLHLKPGSTLKALNIRHLTDEGGTTHAVEPVKGNSHAYTIPPLTAQNKKYRFRNFTGTLVQYHLIIKRPNGSTLLYEYLSYATSTPAGFKTLLYSLFNLIIDITSFTITTGDDYVDVELEIQGVTGFDYTLSTDSSTVETILIQEAIPQSLAGEMITIVSYDLMGDVFTWSTPQTELPSNLSVSIIGIAGNDQFLTITTDSTHGLSVGQKIIISNSTLTSFTGANGSSIISSVPSSTTFIIPNTTGEFFTPGFQHNENSNISINNVSIGEVGVAVHDINTDIWTYTRLLRCRDWNFRTKKQIDCHVEVNNVYYSLYWCDDYNLNRVMYYSGDFVIDGAIQEFNSNGQYDYATVSDETRLVLSSTGINLTYVQQLQSGGGGYVWGGNWRYAARLLSESLTPTDLTDLSNPINVYTAGTGDDSKTIFGNVGNTLTSKQHKFTVTGLKLGLFKYIELIGVHYVNNAFYLVIIRRELISGETMTLFHTGAETLREFSKEELLKVTPNYLTAKNITAIDKRLCFSNLTTTQQKDFSDWAKTFKHTIKRKKLTAVRSVIQNNLRFGEYQDPDNVHKYTGYMPNETYRMGNKVKFKTGGESLDFWIDDIIIDVNQTTNAANPNDNRRVQAGDIPILSFVVPAGNGDTAWTVTTSVPHGLQVGDSFTIANQLIFIFLNGNYVVTSVISITKFVFVRPYYGSGNTITSNWQMGTIISGELFTDYNFTEVTSSNYPDNIYVPYIEFSNIDLDYLIDGVRVRDLVEDIVFTRVEMTEQTKEVLASGMIALGVSGTSEMLGKTEYIDNAIGEFPAISGAFGFLPWDFTYPHTYPEEKRNYGTFYSPDLIWGFQSISYNSGDKLYTYGCSGANFRREGYHSVYGEYHGMHQQSSHRTYLIEDVKKITKGNTVVVGGETYSTILKYYAAGNVELITHTITALVIKTTTPIQNNANTIDRGFYHCQYYRDKGKGEKFGAKRTSVYIPTGTSYKITNLSPVIIGDGIIKVFGGDVFNQKTYLKHRYIHSQSHTPMDGRKGGGVAFWSQNRINTQMRISESTANFNFPNVGMQDWLEELTETLYPYNFGYNPQNNIEANAAFDPNAIQQTNMPVRKIWSNIKPQGSLVDFYRIFNDLDFHDDDLSFGEIIHMANGNGELITWQLRKFMRQYFNTRGVLTTSDASEIVIGSGAVMDRDGQTLTAYGCQNKWSIIKGKSAQGNDVFYWINVELKKAIRFGYDGTISLADIRGMRSFFANSLDWVKGKDTPADDEGIHGVWDDRFSDVIWTVRGRKRITGYLASIGPILLGATTTQRKVLYSAGQAVINSQTGEIYEASAGATNLNFPLLSYWTLITHDNMKYYNEYTLAFNETKNKFTTFFSFIPKIYIKWADTFLSPKNDTGRVYRHNKGDYCSWYGGTLEEDGYVEAVVNKHYKEIKYYIALRAISEIVPSIMNFITKNHVSYLAGSDFETTEDKHDSAIKNDSTSSGLNDQDTSQLWGNYLRVKMTFKKKVYQKLVNLIVKFRISARVSTK